MLPVTLDRVAGDKSPKDEFDWFHSGYECLRVPRSTAR